MLKFQIGLIALLIGCVAFISCDQIAELLVSPMPEEDMTDDGTMPTDDMTDDGTMPTDDMTDDGMMPTDDMMAGLPTYIAMYTSWTTNVTYPIPVGTGAVHGEGARTVYINDVGATALEDENMTAYPAGTIIVKEIMDDANTFIQKVATMKKTDDSRHNGWTYKKYARPDENSDYMQVKGDGLPDAAEGCHACHTTAPADSVFVDFSMEDTMTDDSTMPDDMTTEDDTTPTDGTLPVTVDLAGYTSWMSNPLPGPILSGGAHGQNARTVYINDVGATALQDASVTAYPAGTVVVKDIMDATNTSVQSRAIMVKTDDSTYTDHNGWIYKYVDINAESVEVGSDGLDGQQGCHGCHLGAAMDSVFAFPIAGTDGEEQ